MRAIVTGQVGVDKGPYLDTVAERPGRRARTWSSATSGG